MDGAIFYWLYWIGWVITTFLMNKGKLRTLVATCLLISIAFSTSVVTLFNTDINALVILYFLGCYFLIRKYPKRSQFYYLIVSLSITMAYVSFHVFSLFDPVWLVFNKLWMLVFLLVYLNLLLVKNVLARLLTLLLGILHGEVLYAIVLYNFRFPYEIGSLFFWDACALMITGILLWSGLENISQYWNSTLQKQVKERQGT
ncbi:hypothetical protein EJF36_11425 [Bacillus sp. HMF5848]|uniref:YphA family membrane protein n=1 Tax=Bacillus sp. HMF5848 TaxID=2495421 RepID=UPI000F76697E|nr:hypothetical protein [Bacillus sp. HMF5848]RSK27447.1 hypothetical protein EJF36_11425 [Bacillus sp. HMF5848]